MNTFIHIRSNNNFSVNENLYIMLIKTNKLTKKKIIRKYIRSLRHSLTYSEQYIAAQLITNKILALKCIYQSLNIAIFVSIDGEIRTDLLIKILLSMNKRIYLPVLPLPFEKSQCLSFAPYTLSTVLVRNYLNTYEPKKTNITTIFSLDMLDIIFVPLVAFDQYGNRLGMGGGFYDILLQYYQNNYLNCTTIGLGYDFQKVPTSFLPIEKWDMKLHKIITPSYMYWK